MTVAHPACTGSRRPSPAAAGAGCTSHCPPRRLGQPPMPRRNVRSTIYPNSSSRVQQVTIVMWTSSGHRPAGRPKVRC